MKIQKYKFEENEMLQIYINKSEQKDLKIIQEINELKKTLFKHNNVLLVEKIKL